MSAAMIVLLVFWAVLIGLLIVVTQHLLRLANAVKGLADVVLRQAGVPTDHQRDAIYELLKRF